jgi:hypothetical protein
MWGYEDTKYEIFEFGIFVESLVETGRFPWRQHSIFSSTG